MSQLPPNPIPTLDPVDPYLYGWRPRMVRLPDGSWDEERIPLTLEDVLHPQEGDVISERPIHQLDRAYLASVFRTRRFGPPVTFVSSDLLIGWPVEGMRAHSPDVAVFAGLSRAPSLNIGTLPLEELGGECVLAVEVVSPETRTNDVDRKMDHYHTVGVGMYVLIDQERLSRPRTLAGYRYARRGWRRMRANRRGRLELPLLGLELGLREEDQRAVCYDRETGRMVGDYDEITRMLDESDRRNAEMERISEENIIQAREDRRLRAESDRLRAESDRLRLAAEQRIQELERLLLSERQARDTPEGRGV